MVWRKLQHNLATQIARRLVFVDCETTDVDPENLVEEVHRLWFGVARTGRFENSGAGLKYGRRRKRVFYSGQDFWSWLKTIARKKETTWIYAHNAGFDFTVLGVWDLIRSGELTISKPRYVRQPLAQKDFWVGLLLLEDPPTVVGLEDKEGRRYVLCDTLNYWRVSLAALGESVGYEKLEWPGDPKTIEKWLPYCDRDTEIIEQAIIQLITWWKDNDLGNWKWTGPGLAMSAYRHAFMRHDIIFHDRMDVRVLERNGYYGGQLEAFKLGHIEGPVYQYDVTSLYPSVMRFNNYPTRLLHWNMNPAPTTGHPPFEPANSVAEVDLVAGEHTFPKRDETQVYYANGDGWTTLAGPELDYAWKLGLIKRWGRWSTYEVAPIFTEFVQHFFSLKKDYEEHGNKVQREFVKLLLNSLYGKFGQRGGKWTFNPDRIPWDEFGIFHERNPITGKWQKCLGIWDIVLDWTPLNEVGQSFPAIAAFVTSYARQHMRELRKICGRTHYFYQSTDSLIVDRIGRTNLNWCGKIADGDLGQLKLEESGNDAHIWGLHWYRVGDKKIEGAKKASAEGITDTMWSELQFDSLQTVLRRNGSPEIHIKRVIKERSLQYTKGTVLSDGRVRPKQLSDIHAKL